MCKLIIKECRPDDECEYACGLDERRTRARLFVEGVLFFHIAIKLSSLHFSGHAKCFSCRDPSRNHQTSSGHAGTSRL